MELNTGSYRIKGSDSFIEKTRIFLRDFNIWIRNTADDLSIPVIDLEVIFSSPENKFKLNPLYSVGDHAHLNLEGYKKLAEIFYKNYFRDRDDYNVVVCLGDSHTQGFPGRSDISTNGLPVDIHVHSDNQYPFWLAKMTGKTFINRGIAGNTVYGMISRFDREVVVHLPDHCIVFGGTNDALLGIPLDDTKNDMYKILYRCLELEIQPVVGTVIPLDL
jgi:lysophospholipase L1-like esterase